MHSDRAASLDGGCKGRVQTIFCLFIVCEKLARRQTETINSPETRGLRDAQKKNVRSVKKVIDLTGVNAVYSCLVAAGTELRPKS
jgi:hypothetical protein